jgi:hypothetical protein
VAGSCEHRHYLLGFIKCCEFFGGSATMSPPNLVDGYDSVVAIVSNEPAASVFTSLLLPICQNTL